MLNIRTCLLAISIICAGLSGCAMTSEIPAPVSVAGVPESPPETPHVAVDNHKISDLERQLSREQRQCAAEKRRLEIALKDSQKQGEDLQKKLDALLSIDRDLRNRNRSR